MIAAAVTSSMCPRGTTLEGYTDTGLTILDSFFGLLCGKRIRDGLALALRPTLHMAKVHRRPA